jgi:hypothetical protein
MMNLRPTPTPACTIDLDGVAVVRDGVLQGELA